MISINNPHCQIHEYIYYVTLLLLLVFIYCTYCVNA